MNTATLPAPDRARFRPDPARLSVHAVLLAYSKIWLYDALLASPLPDDPWVATALQRYIYEAYPAAATCRARAAALVELLGGSDLQPDGGPKFNFARRLLGWKLAKRLLLARAHR